MRLLNQTSRAVLALACSTVIVGAAHAVGTDAGKSVENTFTLDYQVDGVDQGTITNDPDYSPEAGDPAPMPLIHALLMSTL